jgi:hypothetical protein
MGCPRVIAESDSLEVIFADCVDAAISLDSISFIHCPREANEVAHALARF